MGKATADKEVSDKAADEGLRQIVDMASAETAKSQLIASLLGMGWRLAIAIIVPIVIGVKLDDRFNSKPSYALTGFMLAVSVASYMIYVEYKEIQASLKSEDDKKNESDNSAKGSS